MENMKLIPMTDFVLEQGLNPMQDDTKCWIKTHRYAEFLKKPLTLGMFIPCDEDGEPLKLNYPQNAPFDDLAQKEFEKQYQKAMDRVMFEGCFVNGGEMMLKNDIAFKRLFSPELFNSMTIEDLANNKEAYLKPTLTSAAIKILNP